MKYFPNKLSLTFLISGVLFFSACEKDITVDLPQQEEKIVVEGYITPGAAAYVFVSKTAGFFEPTDNNSLLNSAVKNATVILSDGTMTDTLVAPAPDIGYLYLSPVIRGEVGKIYTLIVKLDDGRSVSSVTTIPPAVPLDSLWFKERAVNDDRGWVWATLSDPAYPGNCYRWFAKRLGKDDDFIAPIGSVSEDKFFNGLSFDFAYNRGIAPFSEAEDDNNDNAGYFLTGDSIVVKFASTTKESFDFWRSAEAQAASNGSPFGSPSPLKSNIIGGMGIWEGFSFTLDTIVAQ